MFRFIELFSLSIKSILNLAIKDKVKTSQIRTHLSVNQELICMYWHIGKEILNRQNKYGWGSKIIDNLSKDLTLSFPNMKGFSVRNLKYMRQFAENYSDFEFVQQVVAQIPWGHNTILMNIKDIEKRIFYTQKTIKNGWSRNVLNLQIESGLYERQYLNKNEKITNFVVTLPKEDSDLANELIKDPYKFEFLNLSEEAKELEIEKELIRHLREFLLELGQGFAFVGEQYHIEAGDEDFYIDLLFYHLKLRCYIVIELKNGKFKPEYAGKLNFYISVVDDKLKQDMDKPTIGLLLCKDKNKAVAQYSLNNINNPIGIAEYTTEQKKLLPSVEELEEELNKDIL